MKVIRLFFFIAAGLLAGCAGHQPLPETVSQNLADDTFPMKFVYIPPGTTMGGSPEYEPGRFDDEARHKITITKGFYLQATEVTQGQWQAVMKDNPAHFKDRNRRWPVENVSWNNVQAFIQRLNQKSNQAVYRLPTEAEWEYACRLGRQKNIAARFLDGSLAVVNSIYYSFADSALFSNLDCLSAEQANYNGQYPCAGCPKEKYRGHPVAVASLKPDKLGLYDMIGNVYEWCQDYYGRNNYPSTLPLFEAVNPTGPPRGGFKVYKGGSWMSCFRYCRPAYRGKARPDYEAKNLGFRLVKVIRTPATTP